MNILRLRYFIDTAESKSFTKAAHKNFVSQPVISQQIAAMERELEVTLFSREKGKVELTPAGESFYKNAKKIVELYSSAVNKARHIHREGGGAIMLGLVTGTEMEELYNLVNQFHIQWPDTMIRPVQETFAGLREKLESGEIDVAMLPSFDVSDPAIFETHTLLKFNMGVLVSRENPLAQKDTVTPKDIEGENIVMISQDYGTETYEHMVGQREKEGYEPNIVETAKSVEFLIMLVEMNRGIAFLPEGLTKYNDKRCKMLHYESDDHPEFVIVTCKNQTNRAVKAFVQTVRDYFAKQDR